MKLKSWATRAAMLVFSGLMFFPGMAPPVNAETIVKFPLAEGGFDMTFDGTVLTTISDGNAGTTGDQDTNVVFTGPLNFVPEITDRSASFTLEGVTATGLAQTAGPVIVQSTDGGTFSLWDGSNTLLISGSLNDGAITGSSTASTGSFFNTTFASFTGGTLASLLDPTSAGLSLALASITSEGGLPGLRITQSGSLAPFVADASGLIEGNAIPEPMSALLLLSALAGGAAVKRRT